MHIYLTINLITEEIYIGKSQRPFEKLYFGSGIIILRHLKKYGTSNFKKYLLYETNNEKDLNRAEVFFINYFRNNYKYGILNISNGGEGGPNFKGKKHSEETKLRISNTLKNKNKK